MTPPPPTHLTDDATQSLLLHGAAHFIAQSDAASEVYYWVAPEHGALGSSL